MVTLISPSKVPFWIAILWIVAKTSVAFHCSRAPFLQIPQQTLRISASVVSSHPTPLATQDIIYKARSPMYHPLSKLKSSRNNNDVTLDSDEPMSNRDSVIQAASNALRRTSWLSWWSQVILTTVSSVTLLFARSVLNVTNTAPLGRGSGEFFLAGSGIVLSAISVFWTWGGARLSRRLIRRANISRIEASNLLRRLIIVGATVNLLGMLTTLLGAEAIVGSLAARVLTSQGVATPFLGAGGAAAAAVATQVLQPLDILVVQANTNTLLSHFLSLTSVLYLTRWVDRLDPPSTEEKSRSRR